MNVGSLFSGIGGIELGFERAGFNTVWFIEKDRYCQAVLRKHWPGIPIYSDIKKVRWEELERPDILTGGFPCQDISNAGKRKGINGERSGLWKYYLKAIRILRPSFAVIENVAALTSNGLAVVLTDLAEIGYNAEWDCIPASSVGAPHRRDRVFIVAYPNNCGCVHRQAQEQPAEAGKQTQRKFIPGGEDVAHPFSDGFKRFGLVSEEGRNRNAINLIIPKGSDVANADTSREWESQSLRQCWSTEPSICRVAHGIPFRVERIKCLGNAVVPQVAEVIAQAIREREGLR